LKRPPQELLDANKAGIQMGNKSEKEVANKNKSPSTMKDIKV